MPRQQRQFKPESHVIWRFDREGKQIGSSVPVSTFQISSGFHPALASCFVVSRDRVDWFSPAGRAYIEFSLDGRMLDQYRIPEILASVNRTPYPALCEDGSVHLGVIFNKGTDQRAGRNGWGIFRLNRDTRQWELQPRSERWGMVFGCDGNAMVTTTDHKRIAWLAPENQQN